MRGKNNGRSNIKISLSLKTEKFVTLLCSSIMLKFFFHVQSSFETVSIGFERFLV